MNICLNVSFLGSTDIRKAIEDSKNLAIKLAIAYVTFKFNGRTLFIGPTADIEVAIKAFKKGDDFICEQ